MTVGPNANDQSWQWLMQWAHECDRHVVLSLTDDYTQSAVETAYKRGRHSVYKELMRLDEEIRKDDVAFLDSTGAGYEA